MIGLIFGMRITVEYTEPAIVAFLDVLGFRKVLRNNSMVEEYFSSVIDSIQGLNKAELKAMLISDSVVLKIPHRHTESLRSMCLAVAQMQSNLAQKDIWLRGGISIGEFYSRTVDEFQIVVGDALARSYEIESKFAKFPRVLIDPALASTMDLTRTQLLSQVYLQGTFLDQPIFDPINLDDDRAFIPGGVLVADALWVDYGHLILSDEQSIRTVVKNLRNRLYEGQEHYEKYRWVQNYLWTSFVSEKFEKRYGSVFEELLLLIRSL